MPYLLVANATAGTGRGGPDLSTQAQQALNDVRTVTLRPDVDLAAEIGRGVDEGRTIVACGGDGTVNSVAQHLAGTEGQMGVLPGGTLNHFARDLGVRDPAVALHTLQHGRPASVDVGRADDRVFVNNLGIGLYPELVRERERRQWGLGKWPALVVAACRVMIDFDPLDAWMAVEGDARRIVATAIFVGNNRFSDEPRSFGRRARLDEGVLDVRVLRSRKGLRGRALAGWREATRPRRVVRTQGTRVEIRTNEGPRPIAVDGEQDLEAAQLEITLEPAALRVFVPVDRADP